EGMLEAIRRAREHKLPFFGICLGLQAAIIEFARNVAKLPNTNSSEFEPECENPVIALLRSQEGIHDMGGTMRLGAYPCKLRPGSRAAQVYGSQEVSERHRHRYEVSNAYRDVLAEYGMRCSGLSPDGSLVEMIELPDHPWFIGCQFHPELRSRPTNPANSGWGRIGRDLSFIPNSGRARCAPTRCSRGSSARRWPSTERGRWPRGRIPRRSSRVSATEPWASTSEPPRSSSRGPASSNRTRSTCVSVRRSPSSAPSSACTSSTRP